MLNNIDIKNIKYQILGVYVDSILTWADHISISNNILKGVGIPSILKHSIPRAIWRSLDQTLILSHISYRSIVWSDATKWLLNKLVILQARAIRHITNAYFRDSTSNIFLYLNLQKLPDPININLATIAYRATNNNLLPYFNYLFWTNKDTHSSPIK